MDIIHAHQYTPYFYSALSRFFYSPPKLVFTEHGRHYPDIVSTKRKIVNQLLNHHTDKIVAVGEFPKNSLVEKEKLPPKKISVIYNGIDLTRLQTRHSKQEMKQQLNIGRDDQVIGYVGRLHPIKDPLLLIRSFFIVKQTIAKTRLIIVGDGEMMAECKELCTKLCLDNVSFLGLRRDVLDIMQTFDVFVLPSLSEATSVTLIEAMASGIPAVCTRVGGNPEIVAEGITGLLSARHDDKMMAKNITELLQNDSKRQSFSEAAQKRVHDHFTLQQMIKKYEELYSSIL